MTPPRLFNAPFLRAEAILILLSSVVFGCENLKWIAASPYATPSESARDPHKSQELTMQAVELIDDGELDQAEMLLRQALEADLYHGPAHNNLGVVYLKCHRYYEAANEFEWARKLMPGHPDPRMNLALTLEHVGRIDEALATYETALEVYPNHIGTLQAICRCQLRHSRQDEHTTERLREIAFRGESSSWRDWAHGRLSRHEGD